MKNKQKKVVEKQNIIEKYIFISKELTQDNSKIITDIANKIKKLGFNEQLFLKNFQNMEYFSFLKNGLCEISTNIKPKFKEITLEEFLKL